MSNQENTLPENWPQQYMAAGRSESCPHFMHWDNSKGVYRCIYECGETDERPPESKIS